MKPYQQVPIQDCGEPLLPIPAALFARTEPHPYVQLAAPYADKSPYYLRQGVLERLIQAQQLLQRQRPGWQIQIFDAYRPIPVQQFMVDYSLQRLLQAVGLTLKTANQLQKQQALEQVQQFWAVPSLDPATPPPHSTGAALDVTLVDAAGPVEMGSPIDEMSPRSFPNHFATATTETGQTAHQNRMLLHEVMTQVGFEQHPQEWWHFSYGDQLWAWLVRQKQTASSAQPPELGLGQPQLPIAQYGAAAI
ncbi:MAG: M15 family metallopeptidase [Elainella sp.]